MTLRVVIYPYNTPQASSATHYTFSGGIFVSTKATELVDKFFQQSPPVQAVTLLEPTTDPGQRSLMSIHSKLTALFSVRLQG